MNTNLATKLNLFNYIQSFCMPDFPHLKILSKSFFNHFFLKIYKKDSMFTLLYGDIDGLRNLNDTISFEKADLAMEELLKTVLHHLPKNVISFRVGGDEFCFILPSLSAEETMKITEQIHASLKSNKKIYGLDFTFAACDSVNFAHLKDMYTFSENQVNLKKHSHLKFNEPVTSLTNYNKKLDELIDITIKTYLKNFRFSPDRYFEKQDLKILSYPILNTITNLLGDNSSNITRQAPNSAIHSEFHNKNLSIDMEVATKIYNLVMSDNINYEDLDSISITDLKCVRNNLSTDSITGAYNAVYRDHYLLPRLEEDGISFKIILIRSLGIKMLNSILSHSNTDFKIKSTFDCLMSNLHHILQSHSHIRLFPIYSGGGDFEIIVLNDFSNRITPNILENILNQMNLEQNHIQLFGMIENCARASNYNEKYLNLSKICELKKNKIKDNPDYFISPMALKLLDISLSSVVHFFKVHAKNFGIYNENEKIEFTKKFINSFINNFNEINISNGLYEKKESNYDSR